MSTRQQRAENMYLVLSEEFGAQAKSGRKNMIAWLSEQLRQVEAAAKEDGAEEFLQSLLRQWKEENKT